MITPPENIIGLIPQRHPMVMIGSLLACDEKMSKTDFSISEENIFCENGFFSESGMIENIAQTAAAQIGYICRSKNIPVPIGFIGSIKNLEIYFRPKAGETINTEIKIENEILGVTVLNGKIFCNSNVAAIIEMRIVVKK